jgi:hypothetical protein
MGAEREKAVEYYALFGGTQDRDWEEARKYGFISAGGSFHLVKLEHLTPGARVWVYLPRAGYAGVGTVKAPPVPLRDFTVTDDDGQVRRLVDLPTKAARLTTSKWESRKTEYVVAIAWQKTVPSSEAVHEKGFFTNQNVVCRPDSPRWDRTLSTLRRTFGVT